MHQHTRQETDSFGAIEVPANAYWGAQTQRSMTFFAIGEQRFSARFIHALARVKKAAAAVNANLGVLDPALAPLIMQAADEVIAGQWADQFPLSVWQTGSGTQTHMNMNEVLANRAIELAGGTLGSRTPVHPNDHVNASQSSNDVFPTAMHVAAVLALREQLLPAVRQLRADLDERATAFADIIKIGRTHLQDATPVRLGQVFAAFVAQLDLAIEGLESVQPQLWPLAIGGTAVGTGLNAPAGFGTAVAAILATETGLPFHAAPNKFALLSGHEALLRLSGACRTLAASLMKIANDIRWLASGPRCGLGELELPANEPGSSIMPGKVNPTQAEALTMVCVQVMAQDLAVGMAGSQGNFELNVYKPLIVHNVLDSMRLLAEATCSFSRHCVQGIVANRERIEQGLQQSLMLVTALTPHIGYDQAAQIAKQAHAGHETLRAAALRSGFVSAAEFDAWVDVKKMV